MQKTVLDLFKRKVRTDITYDVVVCGSGPSGIGAALAAAINGTKVAILEARSQLVSRHYWKIG